MSDGCASAEVPFDGGFEELAAAARSLRTPTPDERRNVLHGEAGILLDRWLTRAARGRSALDIAIGEGLVALGDGYRTMRFGYAGIGDYARERLGINASTAVKMARRAQQLRGCPLLRDAVWLGVVSISKSDAILPVARGERENSWVARAREATVNALKKAVRSSGVVTPEEEENWELVFVQLSSEVKPVWDEALELAGKVLGLTTPKWQRVEVICQEYLGAHPPREDQGGKVLASPVTNWLEDLKSDLEEATRQWEFLDRGAPVVAPVPSVPMIDDAVALDAELRRLAALRVQWDELFGHLAMLFKMMGLCRVAGFASFDHYCEERLGLAPRTVKQRIALERRLYALPKLRHALREGWVSYEKARLIAWQADDQTEEEWIQRARKTTCIALRREIEDREEGQISARGGFDLRMPARVREVFEDAISAARHDAGKWMTPSECLRRIAQHFIDTWKDVPKERNTVQKRVAKRDKWVCRVPGCSRAMAQVHHIVFQSRGGGHDATNLLSMCAAHHLHGIHDGWIRVGGKAPDQLRWELTSAVEADPGWNTVELDGTPGEPPLQCCGFGGCANGIPDALRADAQEIWSDGRARPEHRSGYVEPGVGRRP